MKSFFISQNLVKQDCILNSTTASCYRVESGNDSSALSTSVGFVHSWHKKLADPLLGSGPVERFYLFHSQAIRVSHASPG